MLAGIDARRNTVTENAEPWKSHDQIARPSSRTGQEPWAALERALASLPPPQYLAGCGAGTVGAPTSLPSRQVFLGRLTSSGFTQQEAQALVDAIDHVTRGNVHLREAFYSHYATHEFERGSVRSPDEMETTSRGHLTPWDWGDTVVSTHHDIIGDPQRSAVMALHELSHTFESAPEWAWEPDNYALEWVLLDGGAAASDRRSFEVAASLLGAGGKIPGVQEEEPGYKENKRRYQRAFLVRAVVLETLQAVGQGKAPPPPLAGVLSGVTADHANRLFADAVSRPTDKQDPRIAALTAAASDNLPLLKDSLVRRLCSVYTSLRPTYGPTRPELGTDGWGIHSSLQ